MVVVPHTADPRARSGIVLIVVGLALAALGGALMKLAAESLPPVVVTWVRFTGYFLVLLPIALVRVGARAFRPPRPGVQVLRGVLLALGNLAFTIGVTALDYADAIAILYVYPFLMTLMAPAILGERVTAVAWIGVGGGFLGVLLVVRPGLGSFDAHALFVLATGFCVAFQMLLNRKLGFLADPAVISLWGAMVASTVLLPAMPFFWVTPGRDVLWVLALIPLCTAASQTLMILAMARAEASVLAPFTYSEIVAAVVIGLMMFGTMPDALTWVGIGCITGFGILVVRVKGRRTPLRQPKI